MTTEQLTSPVGQILYMGLDKARPNFNGREEYSIRLMFNGDTPEGAEFRAAVCNVNKDKVITTSKTIDVPKDHFIVSAWSQYKPKILDSEGTTVDEVPYFSKGSTGTAIMTCKVFKGSKGGGLNLNGVVLLNLDLKEVEMQESPTLNNLREAINKVKKG